MDARCNSDIPASRRHATVCMYVCMYVCSDDNLFTNDDRYNEDVEKSRFPCFGMVDVAVALEEKN
jgi:hypothetical protein